MIKIESFMRLYYYRKHKRKTMYIDTVVFDNYNKLLYEKGLYENF